MRKVFVLKHKSDNYKKDFKCRITYLDPNQPEGIKEFCNKYKDRDNVMYPSLKEYTTDSEIKNISKIVTGLVQLEKCDDSKTKLNIFQYKQGHRENKFIVTQNNDILTPASLIDPHSHIALDQTHLDAFFTPNDFEIVNLIANNFFNKAFPEEFKSIIGAKIEFKLNDNDEPMSHDFLKKPIFMKIIDENRNETDIMIYDQMFAINNIKEFLTLIKEAKIYEENNENTIENRIKKAETDRSKLYQNTTEYAKIKKIDTNHLDSFIQLFTFLHENVFITIKKQTFPKIFIVLMKTLGDHLQKEFNRLHEKKLPLCTNDRVLFTSNIHTDVNTIFGTAVEKLNTDTLTIKNELNETV